MLKKTLSVVLISSAFVGVAHAQSNVTLYGLIDAGFVYNNNSAGSKLYSVASGSQQGSRWGLRGNEDLGGGLSAVFTVENGFSVTTGALGQGGGEFGRKAYVGLSSKQYGTFTLGRQYDSVVDYVGTLEAATQGATGYGAHPGDMDNFDNDYRMNNSIKYSSANYGGFSFSGAYSFGGVAGEFNNKQIFTFGAGFTRGPLRLGAGYVNIKDPNYSFFGNNATSSTTATNMSSSIVYSGYASAKTQQIIAAGGSYVFGAMTVGMTYSNTQFKDIGAETGLPAIGRGGSAKFHNAEINARYALTPAWFIGGDYDYTKGYGVNDATYHEAAIYTDYFLSKSTDVYASALFEHASGTDSTGKAARAQLYAQSASSNANQTLLVMGMRHRF